jgi:hypothetical protein
MPVALIRCPVAAVVREVGTFPSHASPLVVLQLGGTEVRIPVTPDEARFFGSLLNQIVSLRLAVDAPSPAPAPAKEA